MANKSKPVAKDIEPTPGEYVGGRYRFLAMGWSMNNGRGPLDPPPEWVRQRLLRRVFDEALKDQRDGPTRKDLEALREEAMAPGSTWQRPKRPDGPSVTIAEFNEAMRLRSEG
jgi:hypothetical protein